MGGQRDDAQQTPFADMLRVPERDKHDQPDPTISMVTRSVATAKSAGASMTSASVSTPAKNAPPTIRAMIVRTSSLDALPSSSMRAITAIPRHSCAVKRLSSGCAAIRRCTAWSSAASPSPRRTRRMTRSVAAKRCARSHRRADDRDDQNADESVLGGNAEQQRQRRAQDPLPAALTRRLRR